MTKYIRYLLFGLSLSLFSCRITKYVPENNTLLDKVTIVTERKKIKVEELEPYVKQKPNYRIFKLFRTQLHVYNLSGRDTSKWYNRFIRKLGDEPVLYDSVLKERTQEDLRKVMVNKGYLNAKVNVAVTERKRRLQIVYNIMAGEPYRIRGYHAEIGNPEIAHLIRLDSSSSLIRTGVAFDRVLLDQERQRVVALLRRKGYYGLLKEQITYVADSALQDNKLDLTMRLFADNAKIGDNKLPPEQCKYKINRVFFETDFNPTVSVTERQDDTDTLEYRGYRILYGKDRWIRPDVLVGSCYIYPGREYNERMVELTYNSFSRLKAVKYVNLRFENVGHPDSCLIDCYLVITKSRTQSYSSELEGTNSAGDFGVAVGVTFQHRNLFRGSETVTAKIRGAYERLSGAGINSNFTELGTELGLVFPKFVFPLVNERIRKRIRATSELVGTYNYQQRPEYTRLISGLGWRYKWTTRNNTNRHSLDLADASYVNLPWITSGFFDNFPIDNPLLRYSYENHFIMRTGYVFSTTNQGRASAKSTLYNLRVGVDVAGNLLNLLSRTFHGSKDSTGSYQVLGISYSQYAKAEIDYSRTSFLDETNSIAWHINAGVACPYGNSQILPFEKRYFAGGANSVRGWSVRSLGPGIFKQTSASSDFVNHSGDIKLDLSVEYRAKLFYPLETTLFIDAGNIWTIRDYAIQQGGFFEFNSFYKQIALAYGTGLRLNFNYFVLRFDLGVKAFDPSRDGKEKWRILKPETNDLALHFAVGYPF